MPDGKASQTRSRLHQLPRLQFLGRGDKPAMQAHAEREQAMQGKLGQRSEHG